MRLKSDLLFLKFYFVLHKILILFQIFSLASVYYLSEKDKTNSHKDFK